MREERHPARAALLAKKYHAGQTDKQGRDYFEFHLKPVAVMAKVLAEGMDWTENHIAHVESLAYLHDLLEDTEATPENLTSWGYSSLFVDRLMMLTHNSGEPYIRYVYTLAKYGPFHVVLVKLADNLVNSTSLGGLDDETRLRLESKYARARVYLMDSLRRMA